MSLNGIVDLVPKAWRPTIVVIGLALLVAGGTIALQARASEFVEARIAPVRKVVKFDHAMMRHIFEDLEQDAASHGRKRHYIRDVKQEAERSDDQEDAE